ncbi:hypothetical protein A3D77_04635 [Candidatus Gottesmanbacteria bacterium RIFCSPHIGHO2_02_FULL_39_11]|uniref:Helix-turn-helix domain-containing protein n=1 Tax=Candidatus Gottesmanbacteria bacterium RIFCSPHIGHO2_02_FULL_39_11 TaxID=1798382 RepID=A0A1F5ZJC9_9BACT|nr:MAG: hypothetical protein A3D77_04635 [Candidatus Gottesmanbacteria bacterium RIFCSPHIGHO2_02_FULL_39_11]
MLDTFFTPKEVAKTLRLNLLTIYSYIRSGDLPTIRFGRYYRISNKDLHHFIKSKVVKIVPLL